MLVEAAAGTGKTTSMIQRMTALLNRGECLASRLAAVTFTRKSAAELRSRFQIELETRVRDERKGSRETNLQKALAQIDQCFIGTIHSFCARLLRERPVEAGVDISFEEIDEDVDLALRRQTWDEYLARLHANVDPILKKLDALGIRITDLASAFHSHANFPDVEIWPAEIIPPPDLAPAREILLEIVEHVERLKEYFPPHHADCDDLMKKYAKVVRMIRHRDLSNPADLIAVMEAFTSVRVTRDRWIGCAKDLPKEEEKRWLQYKKDFEPFLTSWRKYCYPICLEAVRPALEIYDRLRTQSGKLNYQDLLTKAAELLRDKPHIRTYFRNRITHLLVDEFQDTDPLQAQVMMFLTADDPEETDWQRCRPHPGSLFVVGDPKQSIYRFRRADIVTYNKVREIIIESGGLLVTLQANFRTTASLIAWINESFTNHFPALASPQSPVYVPLLPGTPGISGNGEHLSCLQLSGSPDSREHEVECIVRTIYQAVTEGSVITKPSGEERPAKYGDFLIVTRYRKNLGLFSAKLQEYGIPHEVVGGNSMNRSGELALLHTLLNAVVRPYDPVALVAALRSELFGVSDSALYDFKQQHGEFSYYATIPEGLQTEDARALSEAFTWLRTCSSLLRRFPIPAAVEKIAADLGLGVKAALGQGGNVQAGSLAKAIELLRSLRVEMWSASRAVEYIGQLVRSQEEHDGIPALPHGEEAVRVMNLHKVKGLEAPVVFLADPSGEGRSGKIDLNIDRSGGQVKGYMAIRGPRTNFYQRTIALPSDWESREIAEREFEDAETKRLLYVAATRAGSHLFITQKDKYNNQNPWRFFEPYLKKANRISLLPEVVAAKEPPQSIPIVESSGSLAQIPDLWSKILSPTYQVASAKVISHDMPRPVQRMGEHGTEWGSVIHRMLQVALLDDQIDLSTLAVSALIEYGMDPDLQQDAVRTVLSVRSSDIWKRAMNADRKYVEIPFQKPVRDEAQDSVEIILRGVIDLVFLENSGWVIVDYKTDRYGGTPDHHVELYRPQINNYVNSWTEMTGETVAEAGLYFVSQGEYVRCFSRQIEPHETQLSLRF
jgi:ATP-dependent helicase/nuclease subunit A